MKPSKELIQEWIRNANHNEPMFPQVAVKGAEWGAEMELEACISLLNDLGGDGEMFRRYRRPEPEGKRKLYQPPSFSSTWW